MNQVDEFIKVEWCDSIAEFYRLKDQHEVIYRKLTVFFDSYDNKIIRKVCAHCSCTVVPEISYKCTSKKIAHINPSNVPLREDFDMPVIFKHSEASEDFK